MTCIILHMKMESAVPAQLRVSDLSSLSHGQRGDRSSSSLGLARGMPYVCVPTHAILVRPEEQEQILFWCEASRVHATQEKVH